MLSEFNMKKKNIVFICADDWEGMYINGELVAEGHSIEKDTVLTILGLEFNEDWTVDEDWLNERGRLPKKLSDVKHLS